ncbi:MAG: Bug family tripartite tricarboxylate transporter substrate binding protein [Burkholderiaceae bacterium]
MNRLIRIFIVTLAGLSSFLSGASAHAQAWPSRSTIRILIPYPPGGASDVTARLLALKLTESLKQSVVVENKPGANGILALESVAKSPADGYTLLMANLGPNAINAAVYQKLPYDSLKDFTPITLTSVVPLVILVTNSLPVKTMPELIAYAKANPNKLSFASAGNGSANHLAGEMIKGATGVQMTHIPYKGDAPGMPDVISGTVSMMFPTIIGGMPNIKSGSMRPIAVTSAKRSSSLPDIPTVSESGIPGFEAVSWGGVMGPAGLPSDIVKRLNTEIIRILKMPDIAEKMTSLGADIVGSSPEEFDKYLRAEIAKWGKVARENNIRLD